MPLPAWYKCHFFGESKPHLKGGARAVRDVERRHQADQRKALHDNPLWTAAVATAADHQQGLVGRGRMYTPEDVRHEIHQVKLKITKVEAKIEHLEQLDPANQRLPALEEQLVQLLKNKNLLVEHLAELRKGDDVSGASQPEPALNLLHWGYKSASIDSSSSTSHKRWYKGDCELVRLDLGRFCNIAKAKLHAVTSSVTIPAREAMRIRRNAADLEAEATGKTSALTTEAELNVRFCGVVGKGVTNVVNACIQQKQPTWGNLSFKLESRPSEGSGRPDFLIKQTGAANEVDVCGGEGKASDPLCYPIPLGTSPKPTLPSAPLCSKATRQGKLPNVMAKQYIKLVEMSSAVANALMQACSYCQEKGWRFTFITCYEYTFFVWRVEEDRYAVTDGLLHDMEAHGLHTREVLAYIMWMSLEAPWGSQLAPGELRDLEVLLQQQTAVTVLRGQPRVHQGQAQQGQGRVCTRSSTRGSKQLQQDQKPTEALDAAQQRDQPRAWAPAEGAPEYPLTALRFSDIRLGAGQCGPVVQGWLQGVPVAVKATDACKAPDIVELLWHEAQIYEELRDLQGHVLPVMHGCGYWGGRNTFFLATAVVPGLPMSPCTDVVADQDLAQAARQALQAIHQRGVAHGDVRADNILVQHCGNTPQVIFIDFGQAYLHPTPEECQRELADLEAELDKL
ncbi:hypothetical protein QJQ45_024912 [Haematococcus lacustris]|nr:hypothetical protein QJQ45_024912 [Haematococcus lacustris]